MKRKPSTLKRLLIFPLIIFLLLIADSSQAQTKSFYWEQFDVDMTLLENGDLRIVETQVLNFSGEPFTFGYGVIYTGSKGLNDGIEEIRVSGNGVAYTESSSNAPNTFEVDESSDEVTINWYFAPAVGRQTYTFSYVVKGAVRVGTLEQGSGDQIFWKAIPQDHPGRIDSSAVTIRLPEGIRPQQYTGTADYLVAAYVGGETSDAVRINVSGDGRTITYQNNQSLYPGTEFEVRVQFPHGLLNIPAPDWQQREERGDVLGLAVLAVSLFLLVAGPLLALALWYVWGRDPEIGVVVPEYITRPPNDLPPAIVGTLVDEKADMRDIISTLIDLARRGYLTITEEKRNHIFQRTDKPTGDLRPYEKKFLDSIFRGSEERSLNSLRYKFANKLPKLRKMLYEELENEQLVPRSPETVRNSYGCFSFVVLGAGALAFFGLPIVLGGSVSTAVCPAFAIVLTGVALFIASRHMPVKTQRGTEAAAQWLAFKNFLQNIERYVDLKEAAEIFDEYLPYATAFGMDRTWIRKFAKVETTPIPPWYMPRPYHGYPSGRGMRGKSMPGGGDVQMPTLQGMSDGLSGGLQSMSKGLTRMLNSSSTVLKSTRSASSGGGSSGGFSGGFSGGGFSGGGGSRGFG